MLMLFQFFYYLSVLWYGFRGNLDQVHFSGYSHWFRNFFSHDAEDLVSVKYCIGDGCFEKVFNYEASDEQIEALKAKSGNCYQGNILKKRCIDQRL